MTTLKKQKKNTKDEFDERAKAVIVEFAQQVSVITSSPISQSADLVENIQIEISCVFVAFKRKSVMITNHH